MEFSLCLFFAKLVSYTFLFWLPSYIENTGNLSFRTSFFCKIVSQFCRYKVAVLVVIILPVALNNASDYQANKLTDC